MIDRKQRIALACAGLAFFSVNTVAEVQTATLEKATLNIDTDTNDFTISALHDSGFQVTYLTDDNGTPYANLPSMALPEPALTGVKNKKANDVELVETATTLNLNSIILQRMLIRRRTLSVILLTAKLSRKSKAD